MTIDKNDTTHVQELVLSKPWKAMLDHQIDFDAKMASRDEENKDWNSVHKVLKLNRFAHYALVRFLSITPKNRDKLKIDKACVEAHNRHIADVLNIKTDAVRTISRIVGHPNMMELCATYNDGKGVHDQSDVLDMFENASPKIRTIDQMRKVWKTLPSDKDVENRLRKDAAKLDGPLPSSEGSLQDCWNKICKAVGECSSMDNKGRLIFLARTMKAFKSEVTRQDAVASKEAADDVRAAKARERATNAKRKALKTLITRVA